MNFCTKYRPVKFVQVVAQPHVVSTMKSFILGGNVPNTSLLSGVHSTGKTTLARLFATAANCANPEEGEPCGKCKSCEAALSLIRGNGSHPDITEINAASERGIDMIRALKQKAKFKPRHKYRIFIVDEVHALTPDAFQAALKLFEEPPAQTKFINCTTNPEKLPKTILSRAASFALKPIPTKETAKLLYSVCKKEEIEIPKKVLLSISQHVHGHPREALTVLEQMASHIRANKDSDLSVEALLPQILAESAAYVPYLAVQKYLQGLFSGKYTLTFMAVSNSMNLEYLVRQTLESLRQVTNSWISNKLVERDQLYLLKDAQIPDSRAGRKLLTQMADLLSIYVDAQEKLKQYVVDPKAVVYEATLRALAITSAWNKKNAEN